MHNTDIYMLYNIYENWSACLFYHHTVHFSICLWVHMLPFQDSLLFCLSPWLWWLKKLGLKMANNDVYIHHKDLFENRQFFPSCRKFVPGYTFVVCFISFGVLKFQVKISQKSVPEKQN